MQRKSAFTLIELLAVIAVVAILTAILIPTLKGVRERAQVTTSFSNLRQIFAASQMYSNEHRGRIPYAYYKSGGATNTWLQMISPYVEGEKARAEGGDKGAGYIASDVLRCPRWTDSPSYREDQYWKTGYGMNYFLMRPKNGERNIKEPNNEGERSWQRDMFFNQVPYPATTIFFGNSKDFHLGTRGVEELDRWGDNSHVLYVDGRVEAISPDTYYRLWNDPSERAQ